MDKDDYIAVRSQDNSNLPTKSDGSINNRPLLRKSVLTYKALSARENIEREITYIQKKIAALQFGPKNQKSKLSKSAKKRLRKKRQADAKRMLRSAVLDEIKTSSSKNVNVRELNTVNDTKKDQHASKLIGSLPDANAQKKQHICIPSSPKKVIEADKRSAVVEHASTKISKKPKPDKNYKKFPEKNRHQFPGSKVTNYALSKTQRKSAVKPLHDRQHSLYSFVVNGSLRTLSTEDIIWLLELQNSFETNKWTVVQRKERADDIMFTVGIDPNTEDWLKQKNFQAVLLRTTLTFKVEKNNFINASPNSTLHAAAQCKRNPKIKVESTFQQEDKPFSWLGEWQAFTTVLNRVN